MTGATKNLHDRDNNEKERNGVRLQLRPFSPQQLPDLIGTLPGYWRPIPLASAFPEIGWAAPAQHGKSQRGSQCGPTGNSRETGWLVVLLAPPLFRLLPGGMNQFPNGISLPLRTNVFARGTRFDDAIRCCVVGNLLPSVFLLLIE
jgi:hypothetical protein